MSNEITVALLGSATALILGFLEYMRRENNNDHASNSEKLDQVITKIDKVDSRVSDHIEWHLDKSSDA
jgi:uncharacterized FlaG/YvyC family protein